MPLRFDGKIIATKSCDYQTAFGREGDRESGAVPANSCIWVDLTRNKPEIESSDILEGPQKFEVLFHFSDTSDKKIKSVDYVPIKNIWKIVTNYCGLRSKLSCLPPMIVHVNNYEIVVKFFHIHHTLT